jgi:hypothetical protein
VWEAQYVIPGAIEIAWVDGACIAAPELLQREYQATLIPMVKGKEPHVLVCYDRGTEINLVDRLHN